MIEPSAILKDIFQTALSAVDPAAAVQQHIGIIRDLYADCCCDRLVVVGFGKAVCPMARALEESLGELVSGGLVITRYGQAFPPLQEIDVREAGHPLPDNNGLRATAELLDRVAGLTKKSLVVVLVSGGGSSLLVAPAAGITLQQKQLVTDLLLKAGAGIGELNTVRKHLSRVKGGRLAELLHPAATVALILSDVIGDRLDVIASGPTAPDASTFGEALGILDKYAVTNDAPEAVIDHLRRGASGLLPETPKGGDQTFGRVKNIIIGSNRLALEAARRRATELGLAAEILSGELCGEARDVGRWLAGEARDRLARNPSSTPLCLISGGETTVTVSGAGRGGRNMELALAFALATEGTGGITLLSAGTDGIDGPTDAAGAIADGSTITLARQSGLDPERYLTDNDSHTFFTRTGGLLVTGPTGTNVMDMQLLLIGKAPCTLSSPLP